MDDPSGGDYALSMLSLRRWLRARHLPASSPRSAFRRFTLETLARDAAIQGCVQRSDLTLGDVVVVRTRNSVYSLLAIGDGRFGVCGGWFDREGLSPATVSVNGCTWGGSAIKTDVVAGRGLFLEFGNGVVTTRISGLEVIRSDDAGSGTVH